MRDPPAVWPPALASCPSRARADTPAHTRGRRAAGGPLRQGPGSPPSGLAGAAGAADRGSPRRRRLPGPGRAAGPGVTCPGRAPPRGPGGVVPPGQHAAMTAVRVLLADDQELVRAGLRMMVDSAPDLAVVAEAATGTQAVRLARQARADVVLMDIRMPGLDGLAATRQITADEDLAGVKVLILTTFEVDEYVFEALRSGASGFLGKGSRPDVLIDAIRTVARGDALLSPVATRGLIARFLTMHDPGPATAPSSSSSPTRPACPAATCRAGCDLVDRRVTAVAKRR